MSTLIEFDGVCKYYQMGDTLVKAADHVSFKINKGEFVAIVGQSGSGKSTCMNIIGCLDVPTEGTYLLDGRDVGKMSRRELASIRNEKLGFIFQQYNLLPKLTLLENVEVPLVYAGIPAAQRHATAKAALERVGLGNKLKNLPNQLSGGQQQRVSIARALARGPAVILADEPTGALDSHTSREVLGMLQDLHKQGNTVVLITHDNSIAVQAERIILNIMQRMSGVATQTAVYANKIKDLHTKVLDTRKTTPGMRVLDKMAVKIGGGENHRMGLFDMILLKDNHIDFAGGIRPAIEGAKAYLKAKGKNIPIECEVRSLEDIDEVFAAGGVDRIMFDNFTPAMTREAVKKVAGRCETESSGGITLDTLREYAETGVDFISVGALTHQIKSLDMSLKAC